MRALIIGASGGIGAALAAEVVARGHATTQLSRRDDGLDVTDEASIRRAFDALPARGFALIVNATGGLSHAGAPEKTSARSTQPPWRRISRSTRPRWRCC